MTLTRTDPETDTDQWLRRYHPAEAAPTRLICFPHAGGSASWYHPVSARFSPGVDVLAVQYPGRQDRRHEPCVTDLGELADRITACVLTLDDRPTVFFGHSMGAVLAFETVHRLENHRGPGEYAVIASGRRAPSTHRDERVADESDAGIVREISKLNGTDGSLLSDPEVLRMALPSLRGDYRAIESYRCPAERRISAPITVLTGDADPKTTIAEATAWQGHTTGPHRLKVFPGGHFFLQEHIAATGDEIAVELRTVAAG